MDVLVEISRESANKLLLNFKVRKGGIKIFTYTSPTYICGVNYFQVKINVAWWFCDTIESVGEIKANIRFIKIHKTDDLVYICKVSSTNVENTDFAFTDDEKWYEFHCFQVSPNTSEFLFDLSVIIDAAPRINQIADLYEDTEWTDFKLQCENGAVNVHKSVLSCISPVFQTMLRGKWKETNDGHIEIPVKRIEVLENFKKYIYLQNVPDEDLESLIELGSFYMMSDLLQRCTVKLVNKLSENNVLSILEVAMKLKLTNLLSYILQYVRNGVLDVSNLPELEGWN